MRKRFAILAVLMLTIFITGCASINMGLMPSSRDIIIGSGDYNDIKNLYSKIIPGKTTLADLSKMGIDPKTTQNMALLNYLKVKSMFLPNPSDKFEDLPIGIQECLKAKELCVGYSYGPYKKLNTEGQGNILARLARCKSIDLTTGWELGFYVFTKNDMVMYKLFGVNTPNISFTKEQRRPLCFLQDITPGIFVPFP